MCDASRYHTWVIAEGVPAIAPLPVCGLAQEQRLFMDSTILVRQCCKTFFVPPACSRYPTDASPNALNYGFSVMD